MKGNIDALRDLVQQKFQSPKTIVKVKTRFCTKKPDAYGVFAARCAMKRPSASVEARGMKRPSASVATYPSTGGWTVETVLRTKGATAGMTDKYYTSPDGKRFRTLKAAKGHGFVVS